MIANHVEPQINLSVLHVSPHFYRKKDHVRLTVALDFSDLGLYAKDAYQIAINAIQMLNAKDVLVHSFN